MWSFANQLFHYTDLNLFGIRRPGLRDTGILHAPLLNVKFPYNDHGNMTADRTRSLDGLIYCLGKEVLLRTRMVALYYIPPYCEWRLCLSSSRLSDRSL